MKRLLLIISIIVFEITLQAQPIIIDLTSINIGEDTILALDIKSFDKIVLLNSLPKPDIKYEIVVKKERLPIETINIDGLSNVLSGYSAEMDSMESECGELKDSISNLNYYLNRNNNPNEKEFKKRMEALNDLADKTENCPGLKAEIYTLNEATKRIQELNQKYTIERGTQIDIFVHRDDKTWKFTIKGEPVGKWVTHYGFGMVTPLNSFKTYYTEEGTNADDETIYTIKEKEERGLNFEYMPSVLFSYMPYKHYGKSAFLSITGGLGANSEDIAILFGGSVFIWNNLGINAHVVAKNQSVLKGQYKTDGTSVVSASLDFDQLHDDAFKLYFGISISYRFGENPFKAKEDNSD